MSNLVTCITKPHPHSPYEHITHIGGINENGQRYYITREEAIAYMKRGTKFHVRVRQYDVPVTIETRNGVEYIKTTPDETKRDNLLSLAQCAV